jgi:hypothetical protein
MNLQTFRKLALIGAGSGSLLFAAVACSNSDDDGSGLGDASAPADSGAGDASASPDATPQGGGSCSSTSDCPSDQFLCVYPIAQHCSATGVCMAIPEPACQSAAVGCACDGGAAVIPCYFEGPNADGVGGYATAPVTGFATDGCGAGDAGDSGS